MASRAKFQKRLRAMRIERQKNLLRAKTERAVKKITAIQMRSHSGYQKLLSEGYCHLAKTWKNLCLQTQDSATQLVLNWGENLILLFLALKDCKSTTQFVAIVTMFAKLYCKEESLLAQIIDAICGDDLGHINWTSQSGIFDTALKSWETLKNSPVVDKVYKLITTLLALGFLSESKTLSWSYSGMQLFHLQASKGRKTCTDLLEVVISTMKFFVERGYRCFETGSLDPFFFEDDAAWEFQERYNRIITNFDYVKIGSWKGINEDCPWASEADFERELLKVIDDCKVITKSATGHDRQIMNRCLEKLLKLHTDFQLVRTSGGLREAPFSFLIYGASGIGKSTIVNNLITFALQAIAREEGVADYEVDPNSICTLNEMDKYHSDYKSHIQAVLMDDLANAKAKTTQVNPSVNIINFINNVARTAIVAEAELKGKIQIKPKVVAATTNVYDLDASTYSNEPVSILRRFPIHLHATVKEEYRRPGSLFIDGAKLAKDAKEGNLFPDAWEFSAYEFYDPRDETGTGKAFMERSLYYETAEGRKEAVNITVAEVLELFRQHIKRHIFIQKSVVSSSKKIFKQCLCPHGMMERYCHTCTPVEEMTSESGISGYYQEFCQHNRFFQWENYVPETEFCKQKFQWFCTLVKSQEFFKKMMQFSAISCFMQMLWFPTLLFSIVGMHVVGMAGAVKARKDYLVKKMIESRELMPGIFKRIRDMEISRGKALFYFASAILAIYAAYQLYKRFNKTQMIGQGNGMSVHMEEENVWLTPEVAPLPSTLKNVGREDLEKAVAKQLVRVETDESFFNGLFLRSNILAIPGHEMPKKNTKLSIRRDASGVVCGANFTCLLGPRDCILVPGSDIALAYLPRSGDKKDLIPFLPEQAISQKLITTMLYRRDNGELFKDRTRVKKYSWIQTDKVQFYGAVVNYSNNTFPGQCMGVHLHDAPNSRIVGFHAAGKDGSTEGGLTLCSRRNIEESIKKLEERDIVALTMNTGDMVTQSYGIDYTPKPVVDAKSPTKFQTLAQFEHYGTMPSGRVRPKSEVVVSPASAVVTAVTGVANIFGKPANCRKADDPGNPVPSWAPYQKYLSGAGNAYQEFPSDVMEWALQDMIREMDDLCASGMGKELLSRVKVLDDVETVSGIDGMNFVDAMKPKTSMGWPVNKSKKGFLIDLEEDLEKYPTTTCPRLLDEETMQLAARARECWRRNERSYEVFKTCTKDEPTKITKDKVRCFQAAPVSLQVNIRKYYLTLCHFLSMSSLKSECAVGVNAQGKGWHELNQHMTKFGLDRIVAGDFSAYDQHMSARVILLAFKIFEHIARKAGYSEDDLKMMRGCATEVVYPVMSLNGELIQLFGSNPSGQNLTVYINSLVNSLYHRCAFKMIYPNYKGKFSDVVAMMTYGDDVKMSVKVGFDDYNHTNIQKMFESFGIKYTMAEKDAESVPFITHEEADFLKRKSRWEPRYRYVEEDGTVHNGMWIAMLDEASCFKSLHCNLASKEQSQEEVAIQCIEGQCREWWFYGKEHFEFRHNQMKEVVRRLGWDNFMSESFWSGYEAREASWLDRNGVELIE